MNPTLALAFQAGIVLFGAAVLTFLLIEPHFEGRNAQSTVFEVYFHDPFLAYVYVGSIPFFVALQRAFALLGNVRRTGSFSATSVTALRGIHRCALAVIGFVAGAAVFIALTGDDDRPAGIVMCAVAILGASAAAFIAATLARVLDIALQRAVEKPV